MTKRFDVQKQVLGQEKAVVSHKISLAEVALAVSVGLSGMEIARKHSLPSMRSCSCQMLAECFREAPCL